MTGPSYKDLRGQARAARQSAARNRSQAKIYSEIGEHESAGDYMDAARRADKRAEELDRRALAKEMAAA